jgi:hypothetical protein
VGVQDEIDQMAETDWPVPDQLGADVDPSLWTVKKRISAEIMVVDVTVNDPTWVIRRSLTGIMDQE